MIANFSQHQAKYTSRSSYVVSIYKIYLLNNTLYQTICLPKQINIYLAFPECKNHDNILLIHDISGGVVIELFQTTIADLEVEVPQVPTRQNSRVCIPVEHSIYAFLDYIIELFSRRR